MQAIVGRRATREFEDSPVGQPRIEHFINAANLAPSAMNRQPWAFAVLTDAFKDYACRAKLWLLHDIDKNPELSTLRPLLENPAYNLLHGAPVLVLNLATSNNQQALEDCCLAAENFMLAARDEGVGTCWIGLARPWFNLPGIKAEMKIPGDYQVLAPIVLGFPKKWPEVHERNPAEIHWVG
jgi:nitroreductase